MERLTKEDGFVTSGSSPQEGQLDAYAVSGSSPGPADLYSVSGSSPTADVPGSNWKSTRGFPVPPETPSTSQLDHPSVAAQTAPAPRPVELRSKTGEKL